MKIGADIFSFLGKLSYIRPCLALGSWVVVAVLLFLYFVYILDFGINEQRTVITQAALYFLNGMEAPSCEKKSQGIPFHCLKAIIPVNKHSTLFQ